jgi:ribosome biogenesis GTPase
VLRGIIIKAYNSYYYVQNDEKVTMCTLRGRFKKERFSLIVGDEVEYVLDAAGKGVIEQILPRRSILKRPPVANVDQVVLTFAAVSPNINLQLMDRFVVLAEMSRLYTIICINKADLADIGELEKISNLYQTIGYPVFLLSAKTGLGIGGLKNVLYDKITVFAGPSGVGKSTILNTLEPGLSLVTGELSEKIKRGKHTTRFAQLLPITGGGLLVDTPGFSFTEFSDIKKAELTYYFRDLANIASQCKFNTCLHDKEPQCAVKRSVANGNISESRYKSYLEILDEITRNGKEFR